ncbi:MAG: DUF3179 domain-containing protein [Myxococcota bacterium]
MTGRNAATLLAFVAFGLYPVITRADELTRNGFALSPASIPAHEIISGGPGRDGIPALDHPATERAGASSWNDDEPVLALVIGDQARAYPVAILNWHEIVNDTLGGVPILVSFCPLCGTGLVFDRRIAGTTRRFGVSGLLYRSDLLMFDRETESLWSQISAAAVTGPSRGQRLSIVRARMDRWGQWRRAHPETTILARATGHARDYARSPYADYADSRRLFFPAPVDPRYHPKMPTLGLRIAGNAARAYPASELARAGSPVEEDFAGRPVRVAYDAERQVFEVSAPADVEVIEGYWFAWAAFHPESSVYTAARHQ